MSRPLLSLLPCALALSACVELNPARPPPDHAALAPGGVWVAYNLGCEQGCEQIRRGDRLLAVDGRPVSSGAELDAIDLARGEPITLRVAKYGSTEARDVTIVATPNERRPPIPALPPLLTVGAAALDRAPEWARSRLFGHTIPALRFHRADEPRGFINGRELYGRAALIVLWSPRPGRENFVRDHEELPLLYARLQESSRELEANAVDVYFVIPHRADSRFRDHARRSADPSSGYLPIFELYSDPDDGNTLGIMGSAADIREGRLSLSFVLILDRRGIVRFHTRGFPAGPQDTLAAAVDFALHALPDVPAAPVPVSRAEGLHASAAISAQAR